MAWVLLNSHVNPGVDSGVAISMDIRYHEADNTNHGEMEDQIQLRYKMKLSQALI